MDVRTEANEDDSSVSLEHWDDPVPRRIRELTSRYEIGQIDVRLWFE